MTSSQNGRVAVPLFLALAFTLSLSGQALSNDVPSPSLPLQAGVHRWIDGVTIPTVKSSPFSGKLEIVATQQLQDGTNITIKTINMIGRDEHGRTHNEARETIKGTETRDPKISFISIYDPATRMRTVLYPGEHIARVSEVKPSRPTPVPAGNAQPANKREDLGDDTIEGFAAHGMRVTTTYPVGAVGNDRPFDVINETWFSKDLEMTILIRRNDPRYGNQTLRLTEISRSADSALFDVPADYKIVNESR